MVECVTLRLLLSAFIILLSARRAVSRTFNGTYTIVNKANGRRLASNSQGFSATAPDNLYAFHRWRLVPLEEGAYVIVNTDNAMRVFAQAGKDGGDGFLTIDHGPVYQDQRWDLVVQPDASYALVNVRSGRRIMALAGHEGAGGFIAAASDGPVVAEQMWWLIDPDNDEAGPLLLKITALQAEIGRLTAADCNCATVEYTSKASQDELITARESNAWQHLQDHITELERALRLCDENRSDNTREVELLQCSDSVLTQCPSNLAAPAASIGDAACLQQTSEPGQQLQQSNYIPSPYSFNRQQIGVFFVALVLSALTLLVYLGAVRCAACFDNSQLREADEMQRTLADNAVFRDIFEFHVFTCNMPGEHEASRLIKIQCPGVQHGDVDIKLLWNGCDVAISRKATLGVEPLVWKRRIELDPLDGPYEFRDDHMTLQDGFLQLVFRVGVFQSRAVRFPQHFNLSHTDSDLCWECPIPALGGYGTCSEDVTDSTVCFHELSPRTGYSIGGA